INFHSNKWTWLAGVNYRLTDNVFTYAKYSTGYVQGGEFANVVFQPSTAKSWELGVKADMLDNTLRTNLAVFRVDYTNVQVESSPAAGGCPTASPFASQC